MPTTQPPPSDDDANYNQLSPSQRQRLSQVMDMSVEQMQTLGTEEFYGELSEEEMMRQEMAKLDRAAAHQQAVDALMQQQAVMQPRNNPPPIPPPRPGVPPPQIARPGVPPPRLTGAQDLTPKTMPKYNAPMNPLQRAAHTPNVQALQSQLGQPVNHAPGTIPLSDEKYRLEKMDSKHRMGDLLGKLWGVYHTRPSVKMVGKNFFEWLGAMNTPEVTKVLKYEAHCEDAFIKSFAHLFIKGVKYMDNVTRTQYHARISDGGKLMLGSAPFDTKNHETMFSGGGWAIWVMSPKGHMYTCNHVKGELQHSSLAAGNNVLGAGEWQVEAGVIKRISGKSGHYRCKVTALYEVMKKLQTAGVPLGSAEVMVYVYDQTGTAGDGLRLVPATTFLNTDPGRLEIEYSAMGGGVNSLPFTRIPPKNASNVGLPTAPPRPARGPTPGTNAVVQPSVGTGVPPPRPARPGPSLPPRR